jgi:arylsulfatase A-like enzyme
MAIPLVVKWPGVTDDGRDGTKDALVMNMDIVPTVLDLAGADIPSHMDGVSMKPLLLQSGSADWREDLMAEHFGHKDYDGIQRVLYYGDFKYVAHLDDSDELYDLKKDPFEMTNVIEEPKYEHALQEAKRRLHARMRDSMDSLESSLQLIRQKQLPEIDS